MLPCTSVVNPDDEKVAGLVADFKTQLSGHSDQTKKRFPGDSKLSDVTSRLGRAAVELPFELKALEICFDKVSYSMLPAKPHMTSSPLSECTLLFGITLQIASELSSAATELEKEALPALDHLTKRVGSLLLAVTHSLSATGMPTGLPCPSNAPWIVVDLCA